MADSSSRVVGWLLAATLLGGFAGCGGDDKDAEDPEPNGVAEMKPASALDAADRATSGLTDARYVGTAVQPTPSGAHRVQVDAQLVAGERCALVMRSKVIGRTEIRITGGTMYIRADDKAMARMWGYTREQVEVLRGKWLGVPPPAAAAEDCVLKDFVPAGAERRTYKPAGTGEVDGVPVRRFRGLDDGDRTVASIATEGEPLVLEVRGVSEDGPWRQVLTEFNTGATVERPPKRQVIDTEQLS